STCPSSNLESVHCACAFVADRDVLDARRRRAAPHLSFKSLDRLAVSFDERLHAAVREISHPPAQILDRRGLTRKKAKADALHAATDEKTTSDEHSMSPIHAFT